MTIPCVRSAEPGIALRALMGPGGPMTNGCLLVSFAVMGAGETHIAPNQPADVTELGLPCLATLGLMCCLLLGLPFPGTLLSPFSVFFVRLHAVLVVVVGVVPLGVRPGDRAR